MKERDNYGSKYFQTNQLLKPLEVRMEGKGAVEWAAVVKPGRIMFEVGGVPLSVAKRRYVLRLKLPVKLSS
jgi:large subunit ribosomal protein L16